MRTRLVVLAAVFALGSVCFSQNKPLDPHDLSGYWELTNTGRPPGALNTLSNNRPPMTDWGKTVFSKTKTGHKELSTGVFPQKDWNDPALWCDPLGFPRILWDTQFPTMRLAQARDEMIQFFENGRVWRDLWTDGRKLPTGADVDPRWFGYAVGKWDGNTFVVTSNNYMEKTWLDPYGSPHSDQLLVEERYRRTDRDHLELVVNLTDVKTYTATWKGDKRVFRLVDKPAHSDFNDFNENICVWSEHKVTPKI
jgi:hypothetical protein